MFLFCYVLDVILALRALAANCISYKHSLGTRVISVSSNFYFYSQSLTIFTQTMRITLKPQFFFLSIFFFFLVKQYPGTNFSTKWYLKNAIGPKKHSGQWFRVRVKNLTLTLLFIIASLWPWDNAWIDEHMASIGTLLIQEAALLSC